jgi:hypothetical protein
VFEAKGSICEPAACEAAQGCCPEPACEPACEKACKVKRCHKARACEKVSACDPACEKVAACEPACEKVKQPKCHKLYRRPVIELLEAIFGEPCKSCGCETACAAGCATGCDGAAPAAAPAKAPAKAPEAAAPLPAAPKADPSASIPSRGIYQASRTVVRN